MEGKKVIDFNRKARPEDKTVSRLKRKPKNFFFSLCMCLLFFISIYFASPVSRLSVIHFEGLYLLRRSDLVEKGGLRENAWVPSLFFNDVEAGILTHPLVENVSVRLSRMNQLHITVTENTVLGCANIKGNLYYILENGQTLREDEELIPVCRGLIIYGLTEASKENDVLRLFSESFRQLDPLFVSLIDHIEYEPRFGDEHRFSLSMRDGNIVKVNSYTMVERLYRYQTWISSLEEGEIGIFNFDVGNFFQPFIQTE